MNDIDRTTTIRVGGAARCTVPALSVRLVGSFALSRGGAPIALQGGCERLVAFLALQRRPVSRATIAGALWPDASQERAGSCLRSALDRMDDARAAIAANRLELALDAEVVVDLGEGEALARRLVRADTVTAADDMTSAAISALSEDVLPDWYDDWVTIEAEAWRQLRLHALEAMTKELLTLGHFSAAIEAARAAIAVDPLRESPHAALIRVHLAEGNQSEALSAFAAYKSLLNEELGIAPTANIENLVRAIQRHRRAGDALRPTEPSVREGPRFAPQRGARARAGRPVPPPQAS